MRDAVKPRFEAGTGVELPIPTNREETFIFVFCGVVKWSFYL
jgi:hypothetical protein